jgi:hypothetical protein
MFAWLLAILLIGCFAGLGFAVGAIRSGCSTLGALIGLAAAGPVGSLLRPLFPMMGTEHPIWLLTLPVLTAFLLIWLAAFGIGFAAHRPVDLHFKYKEDDQTRKAFEGMSQAIGLFLGLITGVILFFQIGKLAYPAGYLTTQVTSEKEHPAVDYLNKVRTDMASSGWDKVFASLDRTSAQFYQVSDLLGLVYQNPLAHGRVAAYPPFLSLAQRQEFTDIGSDNDLLTLFQTQAGFVQISGHPKVQAILKNSELTQPLLKIDFDDFRAYVETGTSPKYADEKILGRWRLDPASVFNSAKRARLNMTTAELLKLKTLVFEYLKGATLTAYTDNRLVLKFNPAPPPAPAAPAPTEGEASAQPQMSDQMAARYGLRRPAAAAAPVAAAPAKPAAPLIDVSKFDGELTWKRYGDKYQLSGKALGSNDATVEAGISDNGRLVIPVPELKFSLFFIRAI